MSCLNFAAYAQRTFVIAEIGVNHDGLLERAMELVDIAADCGADAVKLQLFTAANLVHSACRLAGYQKERCGGVDPADMLRTYELSPEAVGRLAEHIRSRGLMPLATPFSIPDVETIAALDLPAIKIASPDLVNRPLLRACAKTGRPLIVSTGAASMNEVAATVRWLRGWKTPFVLLHCVSSYPTPADQVNLRWIGELARRFKVPVGYSDHSTDEWCGAAAVAAGARIIEKHLTYDRSAVGPDHAASADGEQFARYVANIRHVQTLLGSGEKHVLAIEQDVRTVSRQSLVVARDLPVGRKLRDTDLRVQRPGTGIPAAQMPRVVGRKIARPLRAGELLQWDMLSAA